ncbi:MAG: hypothetical protein COB66_06100, partial [Coxiella sp. (in: Bacteria)]
MKRLFAACLLSASTLSVMADTSPTALPVHPACAIKAHIDPMLVIPFTAIATCFPECRNKHFSDFKDSLSAYMDEHKKCQPEFKLHLKANSQSVQQWYTQRCLTGCIAIVNTEIKEGFGSQEF